MISKKVETNSKFDYEYTSMTVEELNIEARYPDVKRSFREKCTKEFTLEQIRVIKEIYKWLKAKID